MLILLTVTFSKQEEEEYPLFLWLLLLKYLQVTNFYLEGQETQNNNHIRQNYKRHF
jgi:hypothetical protein